MNVTVGTGRPGAPIAGDFLGLSFEAAAVPQLAELAKGSNMIELLRSLGSGVIRIGGLSADKYVAYGAAGSARPPWAREVISSADLEGVAALSRATGWRVLLTVNAAHEDPAGAALEARQARAILGGDLIGVAIGNEPDRYALDELRPAGWGFAEYAKEYNAYRRAIARLAPAVTLVGPDASSGSSVLPWVRQAARALHPPLLTDHYYPLSRCGGYTVRAAQLLSGRVQGAENAMLTALVAIQRASGLSLRIDETNNVSCHGESGVSNTFAAALWGVDWIARAMSSGLAGLNLHDLLAEPQAYSPLVIAGGGARTPQLHANPEWYALLATAGLVRDRPLPTTVQGAAGLSAAAFLTPTGTMRLVLVNDAEGGPLRVGLRVPSRFSAGPILRLTAPGVSAHAGVSLGGAQVAPSGAWSPQLPLPRVYGQPGELSLEVPAVSAAVVTLPAGP
ncbi:MAG: glycosyl hydrolase family 79 C-terminal domain-containing protein [Solirubrobacteraceae bacterium]